MRCVKCGTENKNNANFCKQCGEALEKQKYALRQEMVKKGVSEKWNSKKRQTIIAVTIMICLMAVVVVKMRDENSDGVYTGTKNIVKESTYEINIETFEEVHEEAGKVCGEQDDYLDEAGQVQTNESLRTVEENENGVLEEYVLPASNVRMYTFEELSLLSLEQLRIARNEIYARHGREFSSEDLKNYFSSKSWYKPIYSAEEFDAMGDRELNEFEIANRDMIVELEDRIKTNELHQSDLSEGYIFQGEPCIDIKALNIRDGVLYISGTYSDMVDDGDDCEFHYDIMPVKENVTVKIDSHTKFSDDMIYYMNVNEISGIEGITEDIEARLYWFSRCYIVLQLQGDRVTYVKGWVSPP